MAAKHDEALRRALLGDDADAGLDLVKAVLSGHGSADLLALALDSPRAVIRSQGLVALGDYARLGGAVDRRLVSRAKQLLRDVTIVGGYPVSGFADDAIDDVLYHAGRRYRFFRLFPRRYLRFAWRITLSRARRLARRPFPGERN